MARANKILTAVIATGEGQAVSGYQPQKTFQATISGTGTYSATVKIEVSMDGIIWDEKTSIALSQADVSAIYTLDEVWPHIRGNVTAITGTDATVNLWMAS